MRKEREVYYIKKKKNKSIFNILFFKIFFIKAFNFNLNILAIKLKRSITRSSNKKYLIISIYVRL